MSQFYAYGRDLLMRPASPATVPIIRQAVLAPPASLPAPPAMVASAPAVFPPHASVDELLGAPVKKGIVPAGFGPRTMVSFAPSSATPLNTTPTRPQRRTFLPPPAPVSPIFTANASQAALVARVATHQADQAAAAATLAAQKADTATLLAHKAVETASVAPSIGTQTAAAAAIERANNAQAAADAHAEKASVLGAQVLKATADAQAAQDQLQAAFDQRQASNDVAVITADGKAIGGSSDPIVNWNDTTGSGGDVPLVAWDQRDPQEAIPVPMPDGTTVMAMEKKPTNWLLFAGIAAVAGGAYFFLKK